MYENAVPVFEMKNRLSYYLHKAESEGPVFISNRGKPAFVLQTVEDFEEQRKSTSKGRSLFEVASDLRKKYGLYDEDFEDDLTDYFDSLRNHNYLGSSDSDHIFDGV